MDRRYIYPSACSSESLDQVSAEAERLFWRLIPHADDYGRFDARSKVVRSNCFPLAAERIAPDEVERWIGELVVAESLVRYEVLGRPFAVFVNWFRFQTRPRGFTRSQLPEPPPEITERQMRAIAEARDRPAPNGRHSTRAHARGERVLDPVLDLEPGSPPSPTPPPSPVSNGHAPRSTRQADPVFETLCEIEGVDPRRANDAERSKLGRARKLAHQGGWEPADIRAAADRWPAVMGSATRTALGLMSNIQRVLNGPARGPGAPRRDRAQEIADEIREEVTSHEAVGREDAGRAAAGVLPGA